MTGGREPSDRPRLLSAEEKLDLLARAERTQGEELLRLLESAGVSRTELEAWRRAALEALRPRPEEKPRVEVRLFGIPEVRAEVVVRWRHRRCLEVLAFLALRPDHRASRSDLEAALWPTSGDDAIDRNFHPTLSAARRSLREAGVPGDPLPYDREAWQLSEAIAWDVDVLRYRAGLEQGRATNDAARAVELLGGAWALRRGELLETSRSAWAEEERRRLQNEHRRLLATLGAAPRRLGRLEDALDAYRSLLAEDPLAETVHVEVMEIYAASGRPDLVQRQFLRLQELLAEIEVEPAPSTQRRIRELLGA